MNSLKHGILNTLIGIFLMMGLFILPIFCTHTVTSSAETIHSNRALKTNELAKIIYHDKIERIDSFLNQHKNRTNFQGNIFIAYKGHLIYDNSFGYSNPLTKKPLSETGVFQLASVTKQFTAMGILMLKERGLLKLSDTVNQYLDRFPYKGITIRMLLNHTSGLPNYMWLLEHHWDKDHIPYNNDVMRLLTKHRLNLYFTPGTRFTYSNTGYVVLASIIENISGQRYDTFMKDNIFTHLNMSHTYAYSTAYGKNTQQYVKGYRQWGRHFRYIPYTINDGTVGDKGIYSNGPDLIKWDKALYENKLISERTKKEAFDSLTLKNGNHYPYGFGFRIKESGGKKRVYHYGKWNGYRTGIIRFIEDTTTLIILNHTDRSYNGEITKNIDSILNHIH